MNQASALCHLLLFPAAMTLGACAGVPGAAQASDGADATAKDACSTTFTTDADSTDLSADFAAGTDLAPAAISIDEDGSLKVCAGTHYVNITVGDGVTAVEIKGAGQDDTTLDGAGAGPVIEASAASGVALAVKDLALNNGLGGDTDGFTYGGGINHSWAETGAQISVKAVTFSNNNADGGGGLHCTNCELSVKDSAFVDNAAVYSGGGVRAADYGAVSSVKDTSFSGNSSGGDAGGFYFNGTATLKDIDATNNTAGSVGGAGCLVQATTEAKGLEIHDNSATFVGGGIFVPGHSYEAVSTLSLKDAAFSGNSASAQYGGGISFQFAVADLEDVHFDDNAAALFGGGAFFVYSTATMDGVSFTNNQAPFSGGGGFAHIFSSVSGDDIEFAGNSPNDVLTLLPFTSETYDAVVDGLVCDDSGCVTD